MPLRVLLPCQKTWWAVPSLPGFVGLEVFRYPSDWRMGHVHRAVLSQAENSMRDLRWVRERQFHTMPDLPWRRVGSACRTTFLNHHVACRRLLTSQCARRWDGGRGSRRGRRKPLGHYDGPTEAGRTGSHTLGDEYAEPSVLPRASSPCGGCQGNGAHSQQHREPSPVAGIQAGVRPLAPFRALFRTLPTTSRLRHPWLSHQASCLQTAL
jgi:hypothetical protein